MIKDREYISGIQTIIQKVLDSQMSAIERSADAIAKAITENHWLYLLGTGHSHMLAEEVFYRAGGLVRVKPMLEESLMLHQGAAKSTEIERLSGYAEIILDEYGVGAGDVIVIISNSGRNSVCIEAAELSKKRGATVIALTNLTHSSQSSSRHPSGKRLFEVADIVLDNCGCYGDASVRFGERMAAPTSTVIGAMILNAIECAVIEKVQAADQDIELFSSSNIDGGTEINNQILKKYRGHIKSL